MSDNDPGSFIGELRIRRRATYAQVPAYPELIGSRETRRVKMEQQFFEQWDGESWTAVPQTIEE